MRGHARIEALQGLGHLGLEVCEERVDSERRVEAELPMSLLDFSLCIRSPTRPRLHSTIASRRQWGALGCHAANCLKVVARPILGGLHHEYGLAEKAA